MAGLGSGRVVRARPGTPIGRSLGVGPDPAPASATAVGVWSAAIPSSAAIPPSPAARATARRGRTTMRDTSTAPRAKQAAFAVNGSAIPTANRNAPIGGVSSWFTRMSAPWSRALAMPRSRGRTRRGSRLLLLTSANVSATPRTKSVPRTMAMVTLPVTMVAARTPRTAARPRFMAMTRRRRSYRSATAPATAPKSSGGSVEARSAIDTRSGSCVCDATRRGPAASTTPSPAFDTTFAASSQRKLRPSRAGASSLGERCDGRGGRCHRRRISGCRRGLGRPEAMRRERIASTPRGGAVPGTPRLTASTRRAVRLALAANADSRPVRSPRRHRTACGPPART